MRQHAVKQWSDTQQHPYSIQSHMQIPHYAWIF